MDAMASKREAVELETVEAELQSGTSNCFGLKGAWFTALTKHLPAVMYLSHATMNMPEQSGFLFRMPGSKEVWLMTCWHGIGKVLDASQEHRNATLSSLTMEARQETPTALGGLNLVPETWTVLHDIQCDVEKLEGLDCALVMLRQDYDTCVNGGVCPFELAEEGEFSSGDRTALLHYPEGRHLDIAMCNASESYAQKQNFGYRAEGAARCSSGGPLVARVQQRAVVVGVHRGKPYKSLGDHPGLKHVATSMSDIRAAMGRSAHLAAVRLEYGGQSGPNVHSAAAGHTLVGSHVDDVLVRLREDLEKHGRAALGGMGGLGKTSIARAYADQKEANSYPGGVHWLDGTSISSLVGSIRHVARHVARDPRVAKGDAREVQDALRRELRNRPKWLVVVDGLDNPCPMQATLCGFFGGLEGGDVLVTTRLRSGAEVRRDGSGQAIGLLADGQEVVEMPLPSKEAALRMLQKFMDREVEAEEVEDAQALVVAVGQLPITVAILGGALASGEVSMAGLVVDLRSTVAKAVPAGEEAISLADWIRTSGLPDTLEAELKELEITCFADLSDLEEDELKELTLSRKQRKQVRQTVHNGIDAKVTAGRRRALLLGLAHVSEVASVMLQALVWLYPENPSVSLAFAVLDKMPKKWPRRNQENKKEQEKEEKEKEEPFTERLGLEACEELAKRSLLLRGGQKPAVHRVVQAALQEAMLAGALRESVVVVEVQNLLGALCFCARRFAVLNHDMFSTMLEDVEGLLGCSVVKSSATLWQMAHLAYYFHETCLNRAMPWLPALIRKFEEIADEGMHMLTLLKSVYFMYKGEVFLAQNLAMAVFAAPDAHVSLKLRAALELAACGDFQPAIQIMEAEPTNGYDKDLEVIYLMERVRERAMSLEARHSVEEGRLLGSPADRALALVSVLEEMRYAVTSEEEDVRGLDYCNELEGLLADVGDFDRARHIINCHRLRVAFDDCDVETWMAQLTIQAGGSNDTKMNQLFEVLHCLLLKLPAEAARFVPYCLLTLFNWRLADLQFLILLNLSAKVCDLPEDIREILIRALRMAESRRGYLAPVELFERNRLRAALEGYVKAIGWQPRAMNNVL